MVKIEANSATSTPVWLLAGALLFFGLRCGIGIMESFQPPKASAEIRWLDADHVTDAQRNGAKFFLYEFSADWCEPCKEMDKSTFLSKDIVSLLNEKFVPVKVIDRKREKGKNSAQVQELEDYFNVQAFPTIVVAMPNGSKVMDHLGMANSQSMRKFLQEALLVSAYFRGKEELIAGDSAAAAKSFEEFLDSNKWQHWRCVYAAIFGSVAEREIGEAGKADMLIEKALKQAHEHTFPFPVLEYLSGKRSFDKLLSEASENKTNRTICYAYAGMDEFSRQKYDEALKKFEWVKENCDDKTCFEYRVSMKWLERTRAALGQK